MKSKTSLLSVLKVSSKLSVLATGRESAQKAVSPAVTPRVFFLDLDTSNEAKAERRLPLKTLLSSPAEWGHVPSALWHARHHCMIIHSGKQPWLWPLWSPASNKLLQLKMSNFPLFPALSPQVTIIVLPQNYSPPPLKIWPFFLLIPLFLDLNPSVITQFCFHHCLQWFVSWIPPFAGAVYSTCISCVGCHWKSLPEGSHLLPPQNS